MDAMNIARGYFDAWNRHDPAGIVAAFGEGGTYTDPASGGAITGEAIGQYAGGLFAAFPDLSFEIVTAAPAGNTVAAEWVMRGVNTGPLPDGLSTGRSVTLPGADFVTVEGDKIRSVKGYFDQKDLVQQLGMQAVVQPHSMGPLVFGTSVYMNGGSIRKPGAFSLTRINVRSAAENAEADRYSIPIVEELAGMQGFISAVFTTVGLCGHTITAWDDAEAPKQMLSSKAHREVMAAFYGPELAAGGMTSVWVPARIGELWGRCESCGRMQTYDQLDDSRKCGCGGILPERPPYW